ncbi:Threonyl alanyl tRNA synthetase SAD [Fusarium albosuccineum]|uniref:Threonyl alanyl tRNA synthetase SAD n=1 Tax=Fusarium albosuccineum TaxID=1237068 RepID=A0A8H4PM90_9HYPO|nr:Threonyl alanyl tRNA synthetase SAD [Fusarium albosuccineum]
MHANIAHRGQFPCPYKSNIGCETLFNDSTEANAHGKNVHERYFCKVPNCVDTVMGYSLTWSGYWQKHRQIHARAAGVSEDSVPEPKKVIIPAPDAVNDESEDGMVESDAVEDDTIDEDPTEDEAVEAGDRVFPLARPTFNIDTVEDRKTSLRERNDKLVKGKHHLPYHGNIAVYEDVPVTNLLYILPDSTRSLRRFYGLNCAGPSKPINKTVVGRCPTNSILNYDTAPVVVANPAGGITRLSPRCVECQANYAFHCALDKYGLLGEDSVATCAVQDCFNVRFLTSTLCRNHLSTWTVPVQTEDLDPLKATLSPALATRWNAEPPMERMVSLLYSIQAGKSHESELRFLDLEFNSSTKMVFEIGMCNAKGDITLDYRTRYNPQVLNAIEVGRSRPNTYMDRLIESSTKKHNCRDSRMTARQVAEKLREQGVGPRTLFVTWHVSSLDLSALREWLESEGEHRVLPDDSQCLPIIMYFRRNLKTVKLKDGRMFPLRLPLIFPLFHGLRHELAGRNHHAVVDAQQLYHMVEIFAMLCRSPKDRPKDWLSHLQQAPGQSGLRQTALETFWKKTG